MRNDDGPNGPDGPDGPDDDGTDQSRGDAGVVAVAVIVVLITVVSVIGLIKSFFGTTPPPGSTCTTSCYAFVKLECPGDRLMGACFGAWGCGNPNDNHPCGTNP